MKTFDTVIVGGGIVGVSIAYHLSCKGAGPVLLLEQNELAIMATGRASRLALQASTKFSKPPLAKLTTKTIPILEEELGELGKFHNVGSLRIVASEDPAAKLDAMARAPLGGTDRILGNVRY